MMKETNNFLIVFRFIREAAARTPPALRRNNRRLWRSTSWGRGKSAFRLSAHQNTAKQWTEKQKQENEVRQLPFSRCQMEVNRMLRFSSLQRELL